MKTPGLLKYLFALLPVIGLMVLAGGCKEKDVPYIIDADEITRYMSEDESAKNLFRSDGLIENTPYTTPLDNATYVDSVVSHKRRQQVFVDSVTADYGSLGMLMEAVVYVVDSFDVATIRTEGASRTISNNVRLFSRIGFFLKLGSDDRPYVGWKLWGIGAQTMTKPPVNVLVYPEGDTSFAGDYSLYTEQPVDLVLDSSFRYIRLSDIPQVAKGTKTAVNTTIRNSQAPARYYQLMTTADGTGFLTEPMIQIDRSQYTDTLTTPSTDYRLYELISMQSFVDTTFQFAKAWVVPYRVQ